jgi:hypothetical protein
LPRNKGGRELRRRRRHHHHHHHQQQQQQKTIPKTTMSPFYQGNGGIQQF